MSWYAMVLLAGIVTAAGLCAAAVWREDRDLIRMTKPSALVLVIALAWLLAADSGRPATAVLIALVASLAGDILLLDPPTGDLPERRFAAGLAAFFVGHLAYLAAVLAAPHAGAPFGPIAAATAALAAFGAWTRWGRPIVRGAGALKGAVLAYELVLLTFWVASWAKGPAALVVGASAFVLSDLLLGWGRFVRAGRFTGVAVMTSYHLAQVLIVWGLLA